MEMLNFFLQACDKVSNPTLISIAGNNLLTVAFLLIGPVPFLSHLVKASLYFEYGVVVLFGLGGRSASPLAAVFFGEALETYSSSLDEADTDFFLFRWDVESRRGFSTDFRLR